MAAECKHLLTSLAMPSPSQGNYMLAVLQLFYTSTSLLGLLDENRRQSVLPSPQMVALDGFPGIHTCMQGDVRAAQRSELERSSSLKGEQRTALS